MQRTVGEPGDAHRDVDAFVNQPHDLVGQRQPNVELLMGAHQSGHDRQDMHAAEQDRRRHDQKSARLGRIATDRPRRVVEFVERAAAALEIG